MQCLTTMERDTKMNKLIVTIGAVVFAALGGVHAAQAVVNPFGDAIFCGVAVVTVQTAVLRMGYSRRENLLIPVTQSIRRSGTMDTPR